MNITYRMDYESTIADHSDTAFKDDEGNIVINCDQLSTPGLICQVIAPTSGERPYSAIYLHGESTIEIIDPCNDEPCAQIVIRSATIETTIYLPDGMSLTALDAAICSAIMAKRAREESL